MLKEKSIHRSSFYVMIIICIVLVVFNFAFPPANILSWDFFGYYMYLPFTFIYHDLGLKNQDTVHHIIDTYHSTVTFYQAYESPVHLWVMKYPMGIAILNAPFFFIGHLWAKISGAPADGFSTPYQYAVLAGSVFYTLLGIYFLRKVLLKFFRDEIVIVTMLIIVFGTNYFFHTSFYGTGAMPHNYLFAMYAVILWLTIRWHEEHKMKHAALLAFMMGLAILSRPSEIICVMIPVLWGIKDKETLKQKMQLLKKNFRQVMLMVFVLALIGLPQLLYWKHFAGKYLYYSYANNPGEGFEFFHPFVAELLFSFRKGWFIYTPVMIFAVVGFVTLFKKNRELFIPLFLFFVFNIYIVGSWSCWWYAESFSQRSLVQSYAVMALPLGFFLSNVLEKKNLRRTILIFVFVLLIALNLFQTWQFTSGIIHPSSMTMDYHTATFGKTKFDPSLDKLLLVNRSFDGSEAFNNESEFNHKNIALLDFENNNEKKNICDTLFHSGHSCFMLDSITEFSPNISTSYATMTTKPYSWVRATAWVYGSVPFTENPASVVVTFEHKGRSYKYKAIDLEKLNLEPNKWNKISVDYLTPEVRRTSDMLKVYIWHRGRKNLFLDDLSVEIFEPQNNF